MKTVKLIRRNSIGKFLRLAYKDKFVFRKTMSRSQLGEQLKQCYEILRGRPSSLKYDIHINKVAVGIGDLTKSINQSEAERLSILPFHTILVQTSNDDYTDTVLR